MTPEYIAETVILRLLADLQGFVKGRGDGRPGQIIADAIREAVAAERERCAKVAEHWAKKVDDDWFLRVVAQEILEPKELEEGGHA